MAAPVTLAHLSDVHLPPLPPLPWRDANMKRVLGWLNWWRLRQRQHQLDALAPLTGDLAAQAPDHIAVTGDLANIGLVAEFEAAARWLGALGPPERVTVIPGNHDVYCDGTLETLEQSWRLFMGEAAQAAGRPRAARFPFVRRVGSVALIGLNSGVPTPPFNASGRLGSAQLAALDDLLGRLAAERAIRVVLIHHPPLPGQAPPRCGLTDAGDLQAVLGARGAELVLHGHNHRAMTAWTKGPVRPVPVVGVPSASMAEPHGRQTLARYNLYRLGPAPGDPIEVVERGLDPVRPGRVVEISRRILSPGNAVLA